MLDPQQELRLLRERVDQLETRSGFMSRNVFVRALTFWWHALLAQFLFVVLFGGAAVVVVGLATIVGLWE